MTPSRAAPVCTKVWTIVISNWRPALANELLTWHWAKAAKRKRGDAMMIGVCARLAGLNPRDLKRRKRRVTIAIQYPPSRKLCDPDAPLKSTLDALKTAGLIVDDSGEWCEWETPKITRGARLETVITIQDLL